ncbi:hypothetical protein HDG32_006911 [Paraburkholderia sp. CI2]|uniref:beta strand repeat-containing protein n=1 Tax=Paraburkholderia sp. CI2 TaxID=2723093 RepID=UPI00160DA8EC|nr:hypothetical protein [Paraburkholderia sp. CI2]MBB5470757.1 hypothetical protein [Paraburkholderia sp. CI2]
MPTEALADLPQISPLSLGNAEAIATLVNNLIGGTAAAADAAAQMSQAAQASDPLVALGQRLGAGMDITGSGFSTLQMFQQVAANSASAGALAGKLATGAAGLGLLANTGVLILNAIESGDALANIKDSDLVSLLGSATALGVAAVAAPEIAIAAGIAAAGLTFASLAWSNSPSLQDNLDAIRSVIAPYYNQLSASDQLSFTNSLSNTVTNALAGGMPVPQLNALGLVSGYSIEVPTSIQQVAGGTAYTFASGTTFFQAPDSGLPDFLLNAAGVAQTGTWMIRDEPGTASQAQICTYADGSWSQFCSGADGSIGDIFVNGNGSNYTISASSGQTFVNENGIGNHVTLNGTGVVNVQGSQTDVTLVGNNSVVNSLVASNNFATTGTGTVFHLTGDSVTFNHNSDGVVYGDSNFVAAVGSNVGVTLVGNYAHIESLIANNGFAVTGTNSVFQLAGDGVTFNENSDGIVRGDSNAIAAAGSGVTVAIGGNNVRVDSSFAWNGFSVAGTGALFNLTGDGVTFHQNSDGIVRGDSNAIAAAGGGVTVAIGGNNVRVDSAFAWNGFSVAGTGALFNLTGDGVTFHQNSDGIVSGDSNAIAAVGSGVTVAIGGNNVRVDSSFVGNGFSVAGTNSEFHLAGDGVTFHQGSNGIVYGDSNSLAIAEGNRDIIAVGNNTSVSAGARCSLSSIGDNGNISMGAGSYLFVNGGNDTVNASGCEIDFGSALRGKTIYINGDNNFINANDLNGVNTNIIVTGQGNYVYANGATVRFQGDNPANNVVSGTLNTTNGRPAGPQTPVPQPPGGGSFPSPPSGGIDQGNGVISYPVPTPPISVSPLSTAIDMSLQPGPAVMSSLPDGQATASLADLQISNLIAGMSSYDAQPAASSTLLPAAQPQPYTMLAASLH